MLEVGQLDPKLVVMVGDISHGILQPFAQACPGRYYNVGIMEPTIVSMAAGVARSGLYPVGHTIAPFMIERSLEQIKLDFCYQGIGGNLISVGSAFDYTGLGCSHHCYSDLALVKGIPNTEVFYPASPIEFNELFKQSYKNNKLSYFRLPGENHSVEFSRDQIRSGKAIVTQKGNDITLVCVGPHLTTAQKAGEILKQKNIQAEVLYYPTIKPFDEEALLSSVSKTKFVMVIEEHMDIGGTGDDVLRTLAKNPSVTFHYDWIGIPNTFQRGYGSYPEHLKDLGLTPENLAARALQLLKSKKL